MSIISKPSTALLLAAVAGFFLSACSNDPVFVALEQEEKTVDRGLNNNLGINTLDKTFDGKILVAAGGLYAMPEDASGQWDEFPIPKDIFDGVIDNSLTSPWCYDLAVDSDGWLFIAVVDNRNVTHAVFKTDDGSSWEKVKESDSSEYRLFSAGGNIQIAVNGSDSWSVENYIDGTLNQSDIGSPTGKITGVVRDGSNNFIIAYVNSSDGGTIEDLNGKLDKTFSDAVVNQLFYDDQSETLYAALSDKTIRHSGDGSSWTKVTAENMITGLGKDNSGNIYAGLNGQGLKKISGDSLADPPGEEENYPVIDLSNGTVISFITDSNGTFYVGTKGMGLWKLDKETDEWIRE